MDNIQCPTNLVDDIPQSSDLFQGKPHAKIADAIANLIQNEPGGKTIGIEGGWGSGKSTVIDIVKNSLPEKDNIVFVFDAWAHESDLLRRSFLEKLLNHLHHGHNITEDDYKEKIAALQGKIKDSTVKTTPKLGPLGLWAALAVLLSPIALIFLAEGIKKGIVGWWQPNSGPNLQLIIGICLYFIPIVCMVINGLIIWKKHSKEGDVLWAQLSAAVIKEYERETKTFTIETPEPTALEFETIFLSALKNIPDGKKLIVVLDNLDRVSVSEAVNILSALQTFLQHGQQGECKDTSKVNLSKLWIIIPYDPDGMKRIWEKGDKEKGDKDIVKHMLDKRFQIRFQVPPLVTTNWKPFLSRLLENAFPSHTDLEERNNVYYIIRLTWLELKKGTEKHSDEESSIQPTPRELINLVNQMGALHRQWCGKVSFTTLAFYCTYRYLLPDSDIAKLLLNPDANFPLKNIVRWLDENAKKDCAVLWFNVEREMACNFLLMGTLSSSLQTGSLDTLSDLKKQTWDLWSVIDLLVPEFGTFYTKTEDFINTLYVLKSIGLFDEADIARKRMLLSEIKKGLERCDLTSLPNKETGEKLLLTLKLIDSPECTKLVIKQFNSRIIKDNTGVKFSKDDITNWISALNNLALDLLNREPELKDSHQINIPQGLDIVELLTQLVELEPSFYWGLLNIKDSLIAVQEGFKELIETGLFRSRNLGVLSIIKDCSDSIWPTIVTATESRLRLIINENIIKDESAALIHLLWEIGSIQSQKLLVDKSLKDLNRDGVILHCFADYHDSGDPETAAWLLYLFFTIDPITQTVATFGKSQKGYVFVKDDLFKNPISNSNLNGLFVDVLNSNSVTDSFVEKMWGENVASKEWVAECLYIISKKNEHPNIDFIINNWLELDKFYVEKRKEFLSNLLGKSDLLDTMVATDAFQIEKQTLHIGLVESGARKSSYLSWIRTKLQAVSKETWIQQFIDNGNLLKLILAISKQNPPFKLKLGSAFSEAISDHVSNSLSQAIPFAGDPESWKIYFRAVGQSHSLKTMRERILEKAISANGSISDNFFTYFGDEIADSEVLKNDKKTVSGFFQVIVEKNIQEGLLWLCKFVENNSKFLGTYNPDYAVKSFRDAVGKRLLDDTSGTAHIVTLANLLGIRKPVSEGDQESTS